MQALLVTLVVGGVTLAAGDKGDKGGGAVKIPDKNLEAALRAVLRDAKGDLTEAQLASNVFILEAKGKKIADLTGLEKCKNLQLLNLADNEVADLTPLKDLQHLQWLDVSRNKVTSLAPPKN